MKAGRLIFNFGIGIFLLGFLFKFINNQYAVELIVFGLSVVFLGYSLKFILKRGKNYLDFFKLFVLLSFCVFMTAKLYKMPHSGTLKTVFVFSFYCWLILEGNKIIRSVLDVSSKRKMLLNGLFLLTILSSILGVVLKYFKVPNHQFAFYATVCLGVVWFVLGLIMKKKG
jgi:hypothetical protein